MHPCGFKKLQVLRNRCLRGPADDCEDRGRELLDIRGDRTIGLCRGLLTKPIRSFGRPRDLWRCHATFSELIRLLRKDACDHGPGLAVQAEKAPHQVALGEDSWRSLELPPPLPDGGDAASVGDESAAEEIHAGGRSLNDQKEKRANPPLTGILVAPNAYEKEYEEAAPMPRPKKKGKKPFRKKKGAVAKRELAPPA